MWMDTLLWISAELRIKRFSDDRVSWANFFPICWVGNERYELAIISELLQTMEMKTIFYSNTNETHFLKKRI